MTTRANALLERNKTAQSAESPEVEALTRKPGTRKRGNVERGVQQILDGAAPYAAALLRDHVRKVRGVKSLKPSVQRACEYVIDHAIGKAKQKVEHSGGILTYAALAKGAEELNKKPRDILADVEEIAQKHQHNQEVMAEHDGDREEMQEKT